MGASQFGADNDLLLHRVVLSADAGAEAQRWASKAGQSRLQAVH